MKVLIIGGTGNIGESISNQLLEAGHDLTIFTRPEKGERSSPLPQGARSIHGNRMDHVDFESQMAALDTFDCVIDMLCFTPADAESAIRAFSGRIGQFIFTSTVDVYTKSGTGYPLTEASERSPASAFAYAHNKAQCERIFEAAHENAHFNVTILRPAHTYSRFFIHTFGWETYFLDRLRKGKPVIVHGDGRSIWAVAHSDDVARAYVGAVGNPAAFGKAYHVSGEEWMTWDAYHEGLALAIGAPPPTLIHIPTDLLARVAPRAAQWCTVNFSHNNIFNNRAAREDLGYRYTIQWEQGARQAYDWLAARNLIGDSADYPFYDRIIDTWQQLTTHMTQQLQPYDL